MGTVRNYQGFDFERKFANASSENGEYEAFAPTKEHFHAYLSGSFVFRGLFCSYNVFSELAVGWIGTMMETSVIFTVLKKGKFFQTKSQSIFSGFFSSFCVPQTKKLDYFRVPFTFLFWNFIQHYLPFFKKFFSFFLVRFLRKKK